MASEKQIHELKQQGAIEAAMDPNSSVSAEDAQRKLVEDSKSAGVAAYSFDPNASIEEKKAQARAVRETKNTSIQCFLSCGNCKVTDFWGVVFCCSSCRRSQKTYAVLENAKARPLSQTRTEAPKPTMTSPNHPRLAPS